MKIYTRNSNNLYRTFTLFLFLLFSFENLWAQEKLPYDTTYTFSHYQELRAHYESLPDKKGEIVFLGNSITERGDWSKLFNNKRIINRGIGGDVCFGVLNRIDEVVSSHPKSVFLMIGINDIGRGVPVGIIAGKIQKIVEKIKTKSPKTIIYLQSILPVNDTIMPYDYMKNKSDKIVLLNKQVKSIAASENIRFLDLYSHFADGKGQLIPQYTTDGIHLSAAGYLFWVKIFKEERIRL